MENNSGAHSNETNLLSQEEFIQYAPATTGQRFLNLVIDYIVIQYGLDYITGTGIAYLLGLAAPEFVQQLTETDQIWGLVVMSYIISVINYLFYYTVCEKLFKGYTLGKMMTGTKAVRQDGGELTLRNAFLRSLCRLVPFEAFSGFAPSPWHDKWTDTTVIKTR